MLRRQAGQGKVGADKIFHLYIMSCHPPRIFIIMSQLLIISTKPTISPKIVFKLCDSYLVTICKHKLSPVFINPDMVLDEIMNLSIILYEELSLSLQRARNSNLVLCLYVESAND